MNSVVDLIIEQFQHQMSVDVSAMYWFLEKSVVSGSVNPELQGTLWIEIDETYSLATSYRVDMSATELNNSMLKFSVYTKQHPYTVVIPNSSPGNTNQDIQLDIFSKPGKQYYVAQIQTQSPHIIQYFDKHLVEYLMTEKSSRVFKLKVKSPRPIYMLFDIFDRSVGENQCHMKKVAA